MDNNELDVQTFFARITANLEKVIVGKKKTLELVVIGLLCQGHLLIEDVPGVGKTILAKSLAISLGSEFHRIQFTPDMLPSDITGVSFYNQASKKIEFRPGPIMAEIILADEINRATPKTQSALLEAMEERQVTVDGITHPLPKTFIVIGTQNPIEYEGTFPLPEAQLDRFLMRLSMGYPSQADERLLLNQLRREHPINFLQPIDDDTPLADLQRQVWEIHVDDSLHDYIVRLANATRSNSELSLGASPRASLALFRASQAFAAIKGRDHVIPDDIQHLAPSVLTHRLVLSPESELRGRSTQAVLQEVLTQVPLDFGSVG